MKVKRIGQKMPFRKNTLPTHARPHELNLLSRRDFLKISGTVGFGLAGASLLSPISSVLAQESSFDNVAVYGATHEMESIDPAVGYTLWARYICDNAYDSLFRYDSVPPTLVNHLARSYEVSDDGLEWVFRLEENVTFHDGTPLRASDVKYTFQRMLGLGDAPSFLWADIVDPEAIETPNEYTVQLTLTRPFGPFLYTLPWLYIVNEALCRANEVDGDWGSAYLRDHDAGSGPFYIEEFDPAVRIVSRWYPEYWKGWPEQRLDAWVYEIHREPATLRQLLQSGQVHLTDRLTPDDYDILAQSPNLRIIDELTLSPGMVKMNNQKDPTNNVEFRRAMAYAFDYDAAISGVLAGRGTRLTSPLPVGYPAHIDVLPYVTDYDRARTHLSQSGVDSTSLDLRYGYVGGDLLQQDFGLVLQASLQNIGVNVTVEGTSVGQFLGSLNESASAAHFNWIWASPEYPDAQTMFNPQYHSSNWGAWYSCTFYHNEEVDHLIEESQVTVDEVARGEIYHRIQQILSDDSADIWVYQRHHLMAINTAIEGYAYQPAGMSSTYFYPIGMVQ